MFRIWIQLYNNNIHDFQLVRVDPAHHQRNRNPQREALFEEMYTWSVSDGFDTLSAQPNSPNESINSKSQIIMMIFSVRSIGKCKSFVMQIFSYLWTLRPFCWNSPVDLLLSLLLYFCHSHTFLNLVTYFQNSKFSLSFTGLCFEFLFPYYNQITINYLFWVFMFEWRNIRIFIKITHWHCFGQMWFHRFPFYQSLPSCFTRRDSDLHAAVSGSSDSSILSPWAILCEDLFRWSHHSSSRTAYRILSLWIVCGRQQ